MNPYLYRMDTETMTPSFGWLFADHFQKTFGYYGNRPRGTKDWLLIYTVSGEGSFRVQDDVEVCRAGDVAILPPGVPHHYAANEEGVWDLLWVHFIPMPEWRTWLQLPKTEERMIRLSVVDGSVRLRIQSAFERLIRDSKRMESAYQQLALASLTEILILLHLEYEEQTEKTHTDDRVRQLIRYLQDHLQQDHPLPALADRAGLSVSRLCHLFKEQTGETISGVLAGLRLQHAAKLLRFTSLTVSEIAAEVGFESPFYFSNRFKKHFGMNPTAFRKQADAGESGVNG